MEGKIITVLFNDLSLTVDKRIGLVRELGEGSVEPKN